MSKGPGSRWDRDWAALADAIEQTLEAIHTAGLWRPPMSDLYRGAQEWCREHGLEAPSSDTVERYLKDRSPRWWTLWDRDTRRPLEAKK